MLILYHIVAFSIGVILDLIIGDPYWMPHPIRLIGRFISLLDKTLLGEKLVEHRNVKAEKAKGFVTVIIVTLTTLITVLAILIGAYYICSALGIAIEAILTAYCLATKSLKVESMKVYAALKEGNIKAARYAVSMIVGRDTDILDEEGITKAAVETVAENTSDGVIAPMIYLVIGGPVLGMTYKAVNTMDSMIGYHNDRYENYGKAAAKLDDVLNFIPSRISACLMILAAYIGKEFNGQEARRIFLRDRFNHKSPNSAQTESVCAGALEVRLAGDAYYFGVLIKKPFIGDNTRSIRKDDIKTSNKLMYMTMLLMFILGEAVLILVMLCGPFYSLLF